MDIFILVLEIIGTVAFAVSGAMTGLQKKMDIFGVAILGLVAAVGGGVFRDLILGITPPQTFATPLYALIAVSVAIIVFLPPVRRWLKRRTPLFDMVLIAMDALGLGVFTVVGIQVAFALSHEFSGFLLVFVGVVTGVGGGLTRDVLAGNTPYIFVRHVYAVASIVGSVACVLLWDVIGSVYAMAGGTVLIVVIRMLSAVYKWNLPRAWDFDKTETVGTPSGK